MEKKEKVLDPSEEEVKDPEAEEDDEVIIPAGTEIVEEDEEVNPEEEEVPSSSGEEVEGKEEEKKEETETVEIDGVTYSAEALSDILATGKKVVEYQKEHPGYDPVLLHKEFTKRTMELADLKRQFEKSPSVDSKGTLETKPRADVSKYRKEDVELFEGLASALGYVREEDIAKREIQAKTQTYEMVKRQQVNLFLEKHPEYRPENDVGDAKWNALLSEFQLYKFPEDPQRIGDLLERVHNTVVPPSARSTDVKKIADILAKKQAAKTGQGSGGAPGGSSSKPSANPKKEKLAALAKKGGLVGFSEEEINEFFN